MQISEQLGTLITILWKGHGWDLCYLQRTAAAKQKGAWEENIFVLHAVDRNTDNLQTATSISNGKIL